MDNTQSPTLSQYEALKRKPMVRSYIVDALLSRSDGIPTGAIVYTDKRDIGPTYMPGIRHYVWNQIHEGLREAAEKGDIDAQNSVCRQFTEMVREERFRLGKLLCERQKQPLGMLELTFEQVELAYNTVQSNIIAAIEAENNANKLLPKGLIEEMKKGNVQVVEDVNAYLEINAEAYFAEVWDTNAAALQLMDRAAKDALLGRSIAFVSTHFAKAQQQFLGLLPMLNPLSAMPLPLLESKITSRKRDVVKFLKDILKIVSEVQQSADCFEEIDTLGFMSDMDTKTIWELVQIVFYRLGYGVGEKRKFWAQLILTLTERAHAIHEHPQRARAEAAVAELNMLLNTRGLDPKFGREGREVEDVYLDNKGNYFTVAALDRKKVRGWKALKLKDRDDVPMYSEDGKKVVSKKNIAGMWVICRSRAKDLDSIMRKTLDYGLSSIDNLNDLAGFEFIIVPDQFIEEWKKTHVGEPPQEWLQLRIAQAAIDLENYLRDILGATTLVEDPKHQLGTNKSGSHDNGATAATYKENKFVFERSVDGALVRVEAQIKDLDGYLRVISRGTPESHARYQQMRVALKNILRVLLPAEIWPNFVENLQSMLKTEKARDAFPTSMNGA